MAVVDVLEQVDVEEADHQRAALTVHPFQMAGQLLQSGATVGKPGQAVGLGQLAKFITLLAQPAQPLVQRIRGHHQQPGHRQLQRLHPVFQQPRRTTGIGDDQYQHRCQRGQTRLRPTVAAPACPDADHQCQATSGQIGHLQALRDPGQMLPAQPRHQHGQRHQGPQHRQLGRARSRQHAIASVQPPQRRQHQCLDRSGQRQQPPCAVLAHRQPGFRIAAEPAEDCLPQHHHGGAGDVDQETAVPGGQEGHQRRQRQRDRHRDAGRAHQQAGGVVLLHRAGRAQPQGRYPTCLQRCLPGDQERLMAAGRRYRHQADASPET